MLDFFWVLSDNLFFVIWVFIAFVVFVVLTKEKKNHDKAALVTSIIIFLITALPFLDLIFYRRDFQTPIISNFISIVIMIISLIVAVIKAKDLHDEE
jgi:ABC-type methionine transport system permease subunit